MSFSLRVGDSAGAARFLEGARGAGIDVETRALDDGRTLSIARSKRRAAIAKSTLAIDVGARGAISVAVPLTTPEQCFHARRGDELLIADDLRRLGRATDASIDPAAIFALLQHGAVPSPLSIFQGVHRVPPGHSLTIEPPFDHSVITRSSSAIVAAAPSIDPREAEAFVTAALDEALARVPERAVIFFSGGVDSALLAARLASTGRRDVQLVNYRFGADDPEAEHARRVARALGLECATVDFDPDAAAEVLASIGRDYAVPFGDFSTVVARLLVASSLDRAREAGSTVDGTGADGAFGVGLTERTWAPIFRAPRLARSIAARALRETRPWERNDRVERLWRALARSAALPPTLAAITAQNALDGVAYRTPPEVAREIEDAFATFLYPFAEAGADRLAIVDLVHVCAGQFAQKTHDPLRAAGVEPLFPFLEPSMIAASFALPWEVKCAGGEAKALLKSILARSIPRELVYRKKSGFTPPFPALLATKRFGDAAADRLLSRSNPLAPFVDRRELERMVARARSGRTQSYAVLCFLWAHLFTTAWLTAR